MESHVKRESQAGRQNIKLEISDELVKKAKHQFGGRWKEIISPVAEGGIAAVLEMYGFELKGDYVYYLPGLKEDHTVAAWRYRGTKTRNQNSNTKETPILKSES